MRHNPVNETYLATLQPNIGAGRGLLQTPVDIHPALDEVRRMPEFQPPQPNPLDELWKQPWLRKILHQMGQALEHMLDALKKIFSSFKPEQMTHLPENIRDVFSVVIGFVIVMAGLYASYLLLTLLLRWKANFKPGGRKPERVFEETLLIDSGHHYQQAQQAAERGDFANGVRELYMATLCLLDEKQIIPFENTRTNQEYQLGFDQLEPGQQAYQAAKPLFGVLAKRFEAIRYGQRHADAVQFNRSQEDYGRFCQILGGIHG